MSEMNKMGELIAQMRGLSEDHEPEGWPAVQMKEITALCDAVENAVPGFDRLEERLEEGAEIVKQDGNWWLFDKDGEGIVWGKSIRELTLNLIFCDCEFEG